MVQESKIYHLKTRIKEYSAKVNWFIFVLICLFTMGSWIDNYGIWSQSPIMVKHLSEEWKIASILTITTQIGQIGPLLFLFGHWMYPNIVTFTKAIYIVLAIGALSCFLLSFFWNYSLIIYGQRYSIGLYILNFTLSLLDGTSTVVFLPYIGANYVKEYIIPNYIGESLAAFIPGVLSLIQNANDGNDACGQENVTSSILNNNNTNSSLSNDSINHKDPLFSASAFFAMMAILLCVSTFAFFLLVNTKKGKQERSRAYKLKMLSKKTISLPTDDDECLATNVKLLENQINNHIDTNIQSNDHVNINSNQNSKNNSTSINFIYDDSSYEKAALVHRNEQLVLLTIVFFVSFVGYGILPSLQTYSVLPYGKFEYNLAVNLSLIALPISIFLTIWYYHVSATQIAIEFIISLVFSIYIIFIAILSPRPPFKNTLYGSSFVIVSWILTQLLFIRIRCLVATRLEKYGKNILLINGALTMLGQTIGALIMFFVIYIYGMLKDSCT